MSHSDSDDPDFLPPIVDAESSSDDEEPKLKRQRVESPPKSVDQEAGKALWQRFLAEGPEQSTSTQTVVSIEKRYSFAGEEVTQIVQVPQDSTEAKNWPLAGSTAKRKPGPRKAKTSLAPLPTRKPQKLSTLDKSALDWKQHLAQAPSEIEEELVANRRGGGYLEKVDFLNRVEARKGEALDKSRAKRRR
ncbi:Craniofacial development protein 1 [Mycena indigotica]|uniref:SWR1-complex protein 5 n=1 Tax=Mycena indigotica TaxID=2126181 RepID=A0A8H6S8Z5_9AGAR|nr:Craniofacial development protein 1 [Mycena indigotica]KAF7295146.1 Craniofacial development protein 1 [Mycena indigotica]